MGVVLAIFVCKDKGEKMVGLSNVYATEGIGLEGDRYALGKGAFSNSKRKTIRHVTLISIEAILSAWSESGIFFSPRYTRRNITVRGVDLNSLVGKRFKVGDVQMRGVELCDPCDRPSQLSGITGFKEAFDGRGGLRAEILSSGPIRTGSKIEVM